MTNPEKDLHNFEEAYHEGFHDACGSLLEVINKKERAMGVTDDAD